MKYKKKKILMNNLIINNTVFKYSVIFFLKNIKKFGFMFFYY